MKNGRNANMLYIKPPEKCNVLGGRSSKWRRFIVRFATSAERNDGVRPEAGLPGRIIRFSDITSQVSQQNDRAKIVANQTTQGELAVCQIEVEEIGNIAFGLHAVS